ncbi:MAG: methionine--tRNA ligase [Candidatus Berkelbacteria bacterium]|nr:methionine--tRNA ligase [Candidatus Berkelbacteria bacterium]
MNKKFYITTPIYYVNDKPHVGSAYTTIAADVLARFYRARGDEVFFLTGVAEHGSKIAASAEKAGKEPEEFVDEMAPKFKSAWKKLNISNDDFIRTTEPRHEKAVEKFFIKLKESGKLYEKDYEGLYCVGHEAFVKQSDLVDGVCPEHKTKPEIVKEKNWFFKLSEYGEILTKKIKSDELIIAPDERKNEVLSFISQGLEDIAVSRQNAKFALPLPWDKNQTIYVWLDELFNYCSAICYGEDVREFHRFWPADLHLVGKDIIKFHCVIWPALLLAIGEEIPRKVFAHGFFTSGGAKMSKSLGNVLDPVELAEKYCVDAVRYFLLREVPFGQDGDVSEEKLAARYQSDLANGLGNLLQRTISMINKYKIRISKSETNEEKPETNIKILNLIEELKFDQALTEIWKVIAELNQFIDQSKPWELAKSDSGKLVEVLSEVHRSLSNLVTPISYFMPETADKMKHQLETLKPEPLFPRIEK